MSDLAPGGGARGAGGEGALAILLHTHMPYVEGFGTWPFGEEWLWEAIACCYLPLLELLDGGAPLTLSLTPVLCDQLEAPGVSARFERFVREVRAATHASDAAGLRAAGEQQLALELERAYGDYEHALELLRRRGGELLAGLGVHARWTSSATHAVLPLLATEAALALQLRSGIASHRRRFGAWQGGLWLPECAYAPRLQESLQAAGVRASCVELSGPLAPGAWQHLRPVATPSGVLLAPIDRATMALVWSAHGYPAHAEYRDYHRLTSHHHNPWSNSGAPYEHERALARARTHAADFVSRTRARLREAAAAAAGGLPGGGLAVCALDTELLGHWWYEGIAWLEAVVEECSRQGLELVALDQALARCEPWQLGARAGPARAPAQVRAALTEAPASSWGEHGDLSTWSAPTVAELAFGTRAAELALVRAGPAASATAVRELLAMQSSDWAFLISRRLASSYACERFEAHRAEFEAALAAPERDRGEPALDGALRNIAVDARAAMLLAP